MFVGFPEMSILNDASEQKKTPPFISPSLYIPREINKLGVRLLKGGGGGLQNVKTPRSIFSCISR